jgi:glycosyltransferase involved in cell wall biosynthesis
MPADSYEVIVVDNGSTDGTAELVERLNCNGDKPIRYVRENRLGLHYARHAGTRAAVGDILLFTDDDATFSPDWLRVYEEAFDSYPEMAAAGGPVVPVWEQPPPQWLLEYIGQAKVFGILSLMRPHEEFRMDSSGFFFGVNMAVRKSVFRWTGFHPELVGTRTIGDGESGLRQDILRRGGLIGYVPEALVYHHIPARRMSLSYIRQWAWHLGAADMYERWWNRSRSIKSLTKEALAIGRRYWRHWLKAVLIRRRRDRAAIDVQFQASLGWSKLKYVWWMLIDPEVQGALDLKEHRL